MSYAIDRAARLAAAAGLVVGLCAAAAPAGPAAAAEGSDVQFAQAGSRPGAGGPGQGIDKQIADLRGRLHITPAQQPQFDAVAQAMRQNASEMNALMQREPATHQRNAVEELHAAAEGAATEAAGLQRLLPPFQALYDSLSEPQKRTADQLFAGPPQGGPPPRR